MAAYKGLDGDKIKGGGSWVKRRGFGHEIFNFRPFHGKCYGYGRPARDTIRLESIADPKGEEYLDGVTVFWVASSKVVGWYKNARVYREWQRPPRGSNREYKGEPIGFYVVAKQSDCHSLDPDERYARELQVPRGRGGMGRYVWYAKGPKHAGFLSRLFAVVRRPELLARTGKRRKHVGRPRQVDPVLRARIENAATQRVRDQYERWGYTVVSRESEKVGWDFDAKLNGVSLLLEVKGLSGSEVDVELTHNEYVQMKSSRNRSRYRICVVTDALEKKPTLYIFSYSARARAWVDHGRDRTLKVVPRRVVTARLFMERSGE